MMNKKGDVLAIMILMVLLVILGFLIYALYQYIPGKPEQIKSIIKKQPKLEARNLSYTVKQFYPNMKFNHNSISYKINEDCSEEKKERTTEAFQELASKVTVISFYPIYADKEADIEVSCTEKTLNIEEDFFVAGEGGAKEIVQTGRYNVITSGIVLLYDSGKGIKCEWPNIELHEILHVLGFTHSQDRNSLMYPHLEACEQKLDESIIRDLKQLYSKENLADLYFEEVLAIKKGRYLDFNVTVKNSGVIDAKNVDLGVFEDKEEIENFDLQDIPFGGGITFQVTNLKLKSRNPKNIEIVIDPFNSTREFDDDNNIAKLVFE